MADIFISYAREDCETAKTLAQALAEQRWSVWWDRHIPSGRRFDDFIAEQLQAARCVIVLWSTAAVRSEWVIEEAAEARERNVLTPALIDTVKPPLGFRHRQAADLIGWHGDQNHPGFARLIEDITTVLGERPPQVSQQEEAEASRLAAEEERSPPFKALPNRSPLNFIGITLNRANRNWMYILVGVLALIVVVGADILYQNIIATGKMTPEEIGTAYHGSTVLIESKWRLVDQQSGKQVFHKYFQYDGQFLPAYVRLKNDGRIVRWLMLDDEGETNEPVKQLVRGSGFVVRRDGFILTNKHIATPWEYEYCNVRSSLLFEEEDGSKGGQQRGQPFQPMNSVDNWIPASASILFDDKKPARIRRGGVPFQSRSERLEVRLPGNSVSLDARLIRTGSRADVALIKIDPPDPMKPVPLADADYKPRLGGPITVIGIDLLSATPTREAWSWRPFLISGVISNLNGGIVHSEEGTEGDAYQISPTEIPRENSGAPVLDSNGIAIGILTFMPGCAKTQVFFAISIKAGHEILKYQ